MTMPQDTLDRIAEQLCAELGQDRLSGYDRTCILSALSAVRAEGEPELQEHLLERIVRHVAHYVADFGDPSPTQMESWLTFAINHLGGIKQDYVQVANALEQAEQERDALRKERDELHVALLSCVNKREADLATLKAEGRAEGLREAAEIVDSFRELPHIATLGAIAFALRTKADDLRPAGEPTDGSEGR